MKKIISILAVLSLLFSLGFSAAAADEPHPQNCHCKECLLKHPDDCSCPYCSAEPNWGGGVNAG